MAFDLTIGTEPAKALQESIQDELQKRGYSPDADPVMAEYITIMLINNKTAEQITAELEDLIGAAEYDASFTEWLFTEAARISQPAAPEPAAPVDSPVKQEERTPTVDNARRAPTGPRVATNQSYNQAINRALPSGSVSGQKRSASARSPSPTSGQSNKSRRMDLPTAPRAMHGRDRDGGQRSLLERLGGRAQGGPRHGRDEIQARIDAVTNQNAMNGMNGGFNGMGGMMIPGNDMAAAAAAMGGGMVNPLALQEMMMNQMALMAQMANNMGLLNSQGQVAGQGPNGFPMNGGNMPFPDGQQQVRQQSPSGRGGTPAGRGRGKNGPLSAQWVAPHVAEAIKNQTGSSSPATPASVSFASPTPIPSGALSVGTTPAGFTPPARPQSPSLCKFGLKCTNALCRYSHPSPVATPESGVVLSNDPCEAGTECKDKDCIKAHVSPAAVGVSSVPIKSKVKVEATSTPPRPPCRFGANCTKAASGMCPFSHPFTPKSAGHAQATPCRFGTACTKATCPFQHPPGRVLPGTFHRGLEDNAPTVAIPTPNTGSMGGPSPHRSVVFNRPAPANTNGQKQEGGNEGENKVVEATA